MTEVIKTQEEMAKRSELVPEKCRIAFSSVYLNENSIVHYILFSHFTLRILRTV
jgi:hypothetical protein